MKRKILITTAMMLFTSLTFAQWISVNSGVGENLQRVQFTSANIGYAAGYRYNPPLPPYTDSSGVIIRTADLGNSWDTVFFSPFELVTDLSFGSPMKGRAVTSPSHILKSMLQGTDWDTLLNPFPPPILAQIPTSQKVTAFHFINSTTGFAGDDSGKVYKTTDGGVTWSNGFFIDTVSVLESFTFLSNNIGIVVGHDNGVIAKTTDGGDTWNIVNTNYNLNGVHSHSASVIVAVGANGTIIKSTDFGNTWSPIPVPGLGENYNSVYCATNNIYYVVGDSGTIVKTIDGGANWDEQVSGTTEKLNSVFGTSPNNCFIAGDSGTILKTTTGGNRMDFSADNYLSEDGFVFYPNPASDVLNFVFEESVTHTIKISNALGQVVLQNETNLREFKLNIAELHKGVYLIEVQSEKKGIITKKIIKL